MRKIHFKVCTLKLTGDDRLAPNPKSNCNNKIRNMRPKNQRKFLRRIHFYFDSIFLTIGKPDRLQPLKVSLINQKMKGGTPLLKGLNLKYQLQKLSIIKAPLVVTKVVGRLE